MRRIGLALVALGILAVLARVLVRALASDETKIRRAIQDAAEGFGAARMDPILDVLAREFVDETSGFRREDLRARLLRAARRQAARGPVVVPGVEVTTEHGAFWLHRERYPLEHRHGRHALGELLAIAFAGRAIAAATG